MMNKVEVKLYGALRKYRPSDAAGAPHHPFTVTVDAKTAVSDLAAQLQIPDGFVNAASVNGEAVNNDAQLHDADKVSLFPPSAGGAA